MAASKNLEIVPDGDIVLICGGKENSITMRVSSHILALRSSVFKTMFRSRFSEGVTLGQSGRLELPLPDEDPGAMAVVCKVLHHCEEDVPMTPADILAVAHIADKYDCAGAFKYHAQCSIGKHLSTSSLEVLWQLLIAAYLFRVPSSFRELSKSFTLSLHPVGTLQLQPQPNTAGCPEVFAAILGEIEHRRISIVVDVRQSIERLMYAQLPATSSGCSSRCHYADTRFAHLARQLAAVRLWGHADLPAVPLTSLLKGMKGFDGEEPTVSPCGARNRAQTCRGEDLPAWNDICNTIRAKGRELEKKVSHICYECAHRGEVSVLAGEGEDCTRCKEHLSKS